MIFINLTKVMYDLYQSNYIPQALRFFGLGFALLAMPC